MPGPLIALWLILGGAGSALLGPPAIWKGRDPEVNHKHYKPGKVEYLSWISSPDLVKGVCHFMVFAVATRNSVHRLRVNGVEQLPDYSWSWPAEIPEGMKGSELVIEFIDTVSGRVVARHTMASECWPRQAQIPYE